MHSTARHSDLSAAGRVATLVTRFGTQIRYVASSLSSTGVEQALLLGLNAVTGSILVPVVTARTLSCLMNYMVNRKVFQAKGNVVQAGVRYAILAVTVMTMAYLAIKALVAAGLALWLASITANTTLFVVNYLGQTYWVFGSLTNLRTDVAKVITLLRTAAGATVERVLRRDLVLAA